MATNLFWLYPHIPFTATNSATPTGETFRSGKNVIAGSRAEHFRASASGTSVTWDWDYGSTIAPDYFLVAHADFVTKRDTASVAYTVRGASDSGYVTGTNYTGTISTASLKGPTLGDSYISLTTTAYRYWRVNLTTTATMYHHLSKIYLGNAFDLGRDPTTTSLVRRFGDATYRQGRLVVKLQYRGVANATRKSFWNSIVRYADCSGVFLRDASNVILNATEVLHCRITSARITDIGINESDFDIDLEEMIG